MNTTEQILEILRPNVRLEAGLSESELGRVEESYGFRFPPDLRELLGAALPLDLVDAERQRFPNWREAPNEFIQHYMDWPLEGVLFDVEYNDFWFGTWGERPVKVSEALAVTRRRFADVSRLIPLFLHRFLPSQPCEAGNPVFSVHQTDVVYYGSDLLEYFENEIFEQYNLKGYSTTIRPIPFWSDLA